MTIDERAGAHQEATTIVREARRADLPRIIELLDQLGASPGQEDLSSPLLSSYIEAFEQIASDRRQRLLVLESAGDVVATAVLIIVPNLGHHGRPYALIENVVVDASQRSQRRGEQLMRHIIDEAQAAGCYKISLTSALRRENAHRFYERLGFRFTHKGFRLDL